MKKILFIIVIIILAQMFSAYQMRNVSNIDTDKMYELTLIKNGVAR